MLSHHKLQGRITSCKLQDVSLKTYRYMPDNNTDRILCTKLNFYNSHFSGTILIHMNPILLHIGETNIIYFDYYCCYYFFTRLKRLIKTFEAVALSLFIFRIVSALVFVLLRLCRFQSFCKIYYFNHVFLNFKSCNKMPPTEKNCIKTFHNVKLSFFQTAELVSICANKISF